MIYFIIIIITNISQALIEQNGQTTICPCQQYSIHTCDLISSCSWNQQNCEDLICKNRNSTYCYGPYSDYKCIWDDTQNYCKDLTKKECKEITSSKDCLMSQYNDMDCTWTINGECKTLDCTRDFDCPLQKCSFINSTCSDPINELNCSSINIDECNYTRNGNGIFCFLNDDDQCQSYNLATHNCYQWSDNQQGCNVQECSYQNKQCKDKTCSHIQNEEECNFVYQNDVLNKTLCFWSDNQCQTLEENNILQVSKEDCQKYSTYGWSGDSCQRCNKMEDDQQPEDFDTKWIIIIVVLLLVIIIFIVILVRYVLVKKSQNNQQQNQQVGARVHPVGPLGQFNNNQNQILPYNPNHQQTNNQNERQQQNQSNSQNNNQNQEQQSHPYFQQINNQDQRQQQNQYNSQNNNQNQILPQNPNHQQFNNQNERQQQNQFNSQNNNQNQEQQSHPYIQQINNQNQIYQQNQSNSQHNNSNQELELPQNREDACQNGQQNGGYNSQIQLQVFEESPF